MSNIFFSSDWHFFHKKIHDFCPNTRRGDSPEAMTELILANIDEQTQPGDVLYNLGDVSFGTTEQTSKALSDIKSMGIKHHLIMGNHDKRIRSDNSLQSLFSSVQDKLVVSSGKQSVVMSHIPFASGMWDAAHYDSWHFFGHAHGSYTQPGKCMDVGIDARPTGDMKLWSFDELKNLMDQQPTIKLHNN